MLLPHPHNMTADTLGAVSKDLLNEEVGLGGFYRVN